MTDDFAHRLPLNQIRDGERIDLSADEGERKLIADRLDLRALDRLEAHATLDRKGEMVRVAMMPGTAQAKLDNKGMKARPDSPALLISRSMMKAARTM